MISRLTYKNQYHFYIPKINQKISWKKDNILSVNKTNFFLGINLTEDIFNKLTGEKLQNIIKEIRDNPNRGIDFVKNF